MSTHHAPPHRRHWAYLATAVLAVAVAGLGLAAPAGASSPPPVNPTRIVAPGPGVSPHQRSVNAQLRTARARLRVHRHQAHPGCPERLTHPGVDHAGAGLARPGRGPAASPGPASSASQPGLDVSSYQGAINWSRVKAHGAQF
ncbi:MAG TPA: hypothetical protein VE152_09910, partial [Acidimicrobiales bacterium]|nr:hypothetical protein [Acidimicrobiales bacterium]